MKCPIKSPLQQVNRSAVFPQVLISPLGRSTKLETEADDHGGDLHSVVGSKSTPPGGTRRQTGSKEEDTNWASAERGKGSEEMRDSKS